MLHELQAGAAQQHIHAFDRAPHTPHMFFVCVTLQGEMAIRIDENVDDTLANVTDAQAQLLKYLNTISSNRWLIMKVCES